MLSTSFIHLGIANVNWVLNISNNYLFGYFGFLLGIFVNVQTWYPGSGVILDCIDS